MNPAVHAGGISLLNYGRPRIRKFTRIFWSVRQKEVRNCERSKKVKRYYEWFFPVLKSGINGRIP